MTFDVVVIGLGAMGSAAACHLARRGVRVVGIERFAPGHDRGSSHGRSRIIRLGYFEHPSYVPLLRRTYELWRELEAASGRTLVHTTGIVEIGAPGSVLIEGTLSSSRLHDLPHEVIDATAVMRRFPAFRLPADFIGVVQPDGGYVVAEAATDAHLTLAKAAGAQLRHGETVTAVEPRPNGVRVTTDRGVVDAGSAIVAAGPWVKSLLPELAVPLRVTRQLLAWFDPLDKSLFQKDKFPVFMLESEHGIHYGFPLQGEGGEAGLKIAKHHHADETVEAETYDRMASATDEAMIRSAMADYLPAANGSLLAAKTCLYTMPPDGDFLIDQYPGAPQIIVASPCSGHGFKFAPVIGEVLADLAPAGATRHDIGRFRLERFQA